MFVRLYIFHNLCREKGVDKGSFKVGRGGVNKARKREMLLYSYNIRKAESKRWNASWSFMGTRGVRNWRSLLCVLIDHVSWNIQLSANPSPVPTYLKQILCSASDLFCGFIVPVFLSLNKTSVRENTINAPEIKLVQY